MAEQIGGTTLAPGAARPRGGIGEAIVAISADGLIALADPLAEKLFGYHWDELAHQPLDLLIPAANPLLSTLETAMASSCAKGTQVTCRRKDGSEFSGEVSFTKIDTEIGQLRALRIGEAIQQMPVAAETGFINAFIQSTGSVVVGFDLNGVVVAWNPAAENFYGYTADEVVGGPVSILYPDDQVAVETEIWERIRRTRRQVTYSAPRLRKDGTTVIVRLAASPVRDASGAVTGIAEVSRDLSQQEHAEAKFRGLLEGMTLAVIGVDASGRIMFVNMEAERLFDYSRTELIGQTVELLIPENLREKHIEHRRLYLKDPHTRQTMPGLQLPARRRDGGEFPAEISLAPIHSDEGLLTVATVVDITPRLEAERDQARLERELHRGQRLEGLGQLAGGVAHDFNNVLAIILNHAGLIQEDLAKVLPDSDDRWASLRRDVEQIQHAAERAARLTRQLLAFGRREVLRPEVLNLNDVVTDVQRLLTRTFGTSIVIAPELAPDVWPVLADPDRMEQVLVNLAVNARDAMPGGGRLVVQTANRTVVHDRHPLHAGRYVELRVTDTGVGMPPDVVDRAFEPFFTTKEAAAASGLGLATVYGIVTQAGGSVRISSEVGIGTTVTALLPTTDTASEPVEAAVPAGATEPAAAPVPEPRQHTVLVVDDEPDLRKLVEIMLSRAGYAVVTAGNGTQAVEVAESHAGAIDLLITDVTMPGMLGKEVAERVRAIRSDIQVLYMSGYAQPLLTSKGTIDPDVALIEKPFSKSTLLETVAGLLGPAS